MIDRQNLKILILPSFYPTKEYPVSGMFFKDQVLALRKQGLDVGVGYPQGRSIRRGLSFRALLQHRFQTVAGYEDGIPTVRIMGWNPIGQLTIGGLIGGRLVARCVSDYIRIYGRPDVMHVHQARWAGYGAMLASRKWDIPYVITEHESYFAEGKIPESAKSHLKQIYANASHTMAVSRGMARAMHEVCEVDRIEIIPNMVDTDSFMPNNNHNNSDCFTFLCLARLAGVKRIDILLRAFSTAFSGNDNIRLVIAGDGPEKDALNHLCEELGLEKKVNFIGAVLHDAVRDIMCQSDAFVLSSDVETFGVVLIEALSCGLPLIATKCGGPEDIIDDRSGYLVDTGDVNGLANAMKQLYKNYSSYDADTLHTLAESRFGERVICKRLETVYLEVSDYPCMS